MWDLEYGLKQNTVKCFTTLQIWKASPLAIKLSRDDTCKCCGKTDHPPVIQMEEKNTEVIITPARLRKRVWHYHYMTVQGNLNKTDQVINYDYLLSLYKLLNFITHYNIRSKHWDFWYCHTFSNITKWQFQGRAGMGAFPLISYDLLSLIFPLAPYPNKKFIQLTSYHP